VLTRSILSLAVGANASRFSRNTNRTNPFSPGTTFADYNPDRTEQDLIGGILKI